MSVSLTIVDWQDDHVVFLDQRLLPREEVYVHCKTVNDVATAIKNMTVRGAPAIGVAAAMGIAVGVFHSSAQDFPTLWNEVLANSEFLHSTRPTAVNLSWGLTRMQNFIHSLKNETITVIKEKVIGEALQIKNDDIATNQKIGEHGQVLLQNGDTVLTHCNAGALCSAGFGTALGVIYAAVAHGKKIRVIADETRPLLQGARLSAWELCKNNIPVTVITDSMAASIMRTGKINAVIVGADRIAANGDTANKIGTYGVAVCAAYHKIPFYVAAPFSTIDLRAPTGNEIPIEERSHDEVRNFGGLVVTPAAAQIKNPAFDVTPHELITAIITEKGILRAPFDLSNIPPSPSY